MTQHLFRGSIVLGCALLCGAVLSHTPVGYRAVRYLTPLVAHLEQVPEKQLKEFFLRCSSEASERVLGMDEGAICSAAQDVLKHRSFGGDFNALLKWWHTHRHTPPAREPSPE